MHDLRVESEKALYAYNYGIKSTLHHKSGIGVSIGLENMSFVEKMEYTGIDISIEMVEGVQAVGSNINRDTVIIIGDVPQTTTTKVKKRFYNKTHFL